MTVEIPGYKIIKTLGKGGMATVYLALQNIFEREVALKVMSKALSEDPTFGQRFMREAQIVSKLIHPNIVTVFDVGLSNGSYFLSMEYVDGADLKQARKQLTFLEKIQAVKDMASALNVSGSKGYVHRDIKPENIMIEKSTKRAVLMDFGIARTTEADIHVTQAGTAIGTPHYMSPEQAKGNEVDPRADLYSLGVVLFYLTAGYVPFEGDSAVAIGIRHITEAVPELPSHLKDLQWFIDKAMAKHPDDRFQTGEEFIQTLDELDLQHIASLAAEHDGEDTSDFDTPTVVSQQAIHHYGDSSTRNEGPEDFTLSFKTQEPPSLNIKWPLYVTGGIIASIVAAAAYLVFTHNPSPTIGENTAVVSASAQNSIVQLVLGKYPKLSKEDQAKLMLLTEQAQSLQATYEAAPNTRNLQNLIGSYQQVLQLVPNEKSVKQNLFNLAEQQLAELVKQFAQGEFKQAQKTLANVLQLFPEHQSKAMDNARAQLSQRSKIEKLLDEGQKHLRYQNFVSPEGDNAAASFNKALAIVPNLKPAHEGLEQVAKALVKQATSALRADDPKTASYFTNEALTVLPNYLPALQLEGQLLSSASLEEKTEALITQAKRYASKGNLFTPVGRNAYEAYTSILALDRNNAQAKQRRDALPAQFEAATQKLINQGQYQQAKAVANEAKNNFPDNNLVSQTASNILNAVADHEMQFVPRIDRVRASGVPKVLLDREQPHTIAVNDKLYIRFDYHNFDDTNVAVMAKLFRDDETSPLGAKHLFVKGPDGDNEFVIDLARGGTQAGQYRIEIHMAEQVISQLGFRIN